MWVHVPDKKNICGDANQIKGNLLDFVVINYAQV